MKLHASIIPGKHGIPPANQRSARPAGFLLALILLAILLPPAAADDTACTTCGMVWTDTCVPFEAGNETAYNEELETALSPVIANLTPPADLRNQSWSTAFRAMHNLFRQRYAFTEWRQVDWDRLYEQFAPRIAAAEKTGDKAAYYRALREYIYAIPDGHVLVVSPDDFGARYADVGGGYGIAVARLDSGKAIVSYVARGSAAEREGIAAGDEVIAWNGTPVSDAIGATSILWSTRKPSTTEGVLLQQQRFLTRAPVGTAVAVTLRNATSPGPRTVSLVAYDDNYDTLVRTTDFLPVRVNDVNITRASTGIRPQISDGIITTRILPGGYTYIAVYEEEYRVYRPFAAAVQQAVRNNSPGIIIDLRYNNGGDDNLASCFAGWFVDRPVRYERATKYDPGTGTFTPVWESWTAPRPGRYEGPVAVLVSPYAVSSGEGLPMIFSRTGRGAIVSFYGTNGAFGMEGVQALMPPDMTIAFPDGVSLDPDGRIQVDSNASRAGGIAPTVRVPLSEDTVARSLQGEDVQLTCATAWLDSRQKTAAPASGTSPAPAATNAALPVLVPALAAGLALALARIRDR